MLDLKGGVSNSKIIGNEISPFLISLVTLISFHWFSTVVVSIMCFYFFYLEQALPYRNLIKVYKINRYFLSFGFKEGHILSQDLKVDWGYVGLSPDENCRFNFKILMSWCWSHENDTSTTKSWSRIHTFKRKVRGEQQPIQLVSEGRQDRLTS